MILVFGGTTEGRIAVKTLDEGEGKYFYSTRSPLQEVECAHGRHISGEMTRMKMIDFCRDNKIRIIIDAAHPFATHLHSTIAEVSEQLGIPAVRIERRYPEIADPEVVWCDGYEDAVTKMKENKVVRLLAFTGVQTISELKEFWKNHDTRFRILNRGESKEKVRKTGFPESNLIYYEDEKNAGELIDLFSPDAILTKESGDTGGFSEKVETALARNVKVFVVRRPALPQGFRIVYGRHGLRREIELLYPEFYPLHTGFTTGACAAAAAKAALIALVSGKKEEEVSFRIPDGETMRMPIEKISINAGSATASVIKDAGDDPDVTDGCRITAVVSYSSRPGIAFHGGEGVGTVTLPGLGLKIGEPAINPAPRKNISEELAAIYRGGLDVTISLENGEALSEKTFNPRVGVVGGVSIIGTTGIIRPFSHEAFLDCIRREMDVALAMKCECVVVNSGGKSERFMKTLYPDLPPHAFIHYGNAIGDTMKIGREKKVPRMAIGIMLGKAVKLAEGNMDTHSHKITANKEFLKSLAKECGCSAPAIVAIGRFNLARELPSLLEEKDASLFFPALLRKCHQHCAEIFPNNLEAVLLADDGKILSRIKN